MQHIIAKLLQDFEFGKINRRQLIQGWVLAATAASAILEAPVAKAAGGFNAVSVNHITFDGIKDYTKVRDFYVDLFGVKPIVGLKNDQCHFFIGGTYITLRGGGNRKGPAPATPFVEHIAIGIDPWSRQMVMDELKRHGIQGRESDDDVNNNSFKDPEGFHLEIVAKKYETPN